ncbi:hypothetical protein FQN54_005150 [Arachnomyces sp. PD_36]|nr:hypothetical protein FQN54_005150 [Arachnomyces sp. PD_36]
MPPVLPIPIDGLDTQSQSSQPHNFIPITEIEALTAPEPNMPPRLFTRDDDDGDAQPPPVQGGSGTVDPTSINMQGLMALFAIICAAFVLGAIWFFFWAKNGGFVWRKGDWEEYKSTVLRRKGVDGKTLSNATASTDLGGGSIVEKGYRDDDTMTRTMTGTMTESVGMTAESESVHEKPKKSRRKGFAETAKQKLLRTRKEEKWEGGGDEDMRAYRHEKPARVGGMNREFEGTYHGSNTEYSATTVPSEYNQSDITQANDYAVAGPSSRPRGGHIRTVSGFSFDGNEEEEALSTITEEHRLRDSATSRRHHQSRNDHHRTERSERSHPRQSHRSSHHHSRSRQSSPEKKRRPRNSMPGGYTDPLDLSSTASSDYQYSHVDGSDTGTGTKSYRHPIPGLSGKGYRRAAGGSGQKGRRRRDSLSDSEAEDESRLS